MLNNASEESVAVVEDVTLWWLVIDGPTVTEPLSLTVWRGFDEERDGTA